MNMKNETGYRTLLKLLLGLTGIVFAVSSFVLPVIGFAEEPASARQKFVMPQEQVYLDETQVEAAKKQLEEDAFYNDNPQTKNVEVVSGDRVIANVEVVEKEEKPPAVKEEPVPAAAPPQAATEKTLAPAETTPPAPAENLPAPAPAAKEPVKKPIRLHHFGVKEYLAHQATVGDLLKDIKINMEGRSVYPPPETAISNGLVIHVLARRSFLSQEEAEIPFGKNIINDEELAYGTEKVEKEGVKGKELITYENIITRAGHEQKIELDRRRVVEPVNAVVRKGVAQSILTPDGYVKYKKVIYGEATAYTWGGGATGPTSVGLAPKRGIIAVDPRVIPYYTKVYIPGYGMAIAGDTGGAIVGTRIDLFMDSLHECYQWGRRDVKIYILE